MSEILEDLTKEKRHRNGHDHIFCWCSDSQSPVRPDLVAKCSKEGGPLSDHHVRPNREEGVLRSVGFRVRVQCPACHERWEDPVRACSLPSQSALGLAHDSWGGTPSVFSPPSCLQKVDAPQHRCRCSLFFFFALLDIFLLRGDPVVISSLF